MNFEHYFCIKFFIFKNESPIMAVLFILFDKNEGDPMKRSLYNRINSQGAYPWILSSLVCTPVWTWRVFNGPLKTYMADLVIFVSNSCIIWVLLCLTEAFVIRSFLLTKFQVPRIALVALTQFLGKLTSAGVVKSLFP